MMELRNAVFDKDEEFKAKFGAKLSKRSLTNHAMIADMNGATTQNMWEFFRGCDPKSERVIFNGTEYFLVRDARKNVIRALLVDDDGIPISESEIDFSQQVAAQQQLLPPPSRTPMTPPSSQSAHRDASERQSSEPEIQEPKKRRGRPRKAEKKEEA